jgi:hypothetical protein
MTPNFSNINIPKFLLNYNVTLGKMYMQFLMAAKYRLHRCPHSVLLDKWAISINHVSGSLFVVSTRAVASFVSPMWNQPASESSELYWERQHFEVNRSR